MENNDLGDKKINNEQELNEGFSGENISDNYDPSKAQLKPDLEIDQEGNHKFVQRATFNNEKTDRSWNENESLSREIEIKSENKDRNSDIATNRYPNAHPDNHHDRGNINLDQ